MFGSWKKKTISAASLGVAVALLAQAPCAAWAWRSAPPAYWRGPVYREVPREHYVVRYREDRFYYSGGWFYRRGPGRLVLVPPPFGVVVPVLPLGFATFVVGGITYYELNGIYYRQVPEGYTVVEPPVREALPPAAAPAQEVVVQSELLNVRSGPGLDKDVVTQLSRGAAVKVLGNIPEWYYVELNDGERGWVMEKFVVPVKPVPEG